MAQCSITSGSWQQKRPSGLAASTPVTAYTTTAQRQKLWQVRALGVAVGRFGWSPDQEVVTCGHYHRWAVVMLQFSVGLEVWFLTAFVNQQSSS
jgi:hypothetical protein